MFYFVCRRLGMSKLASNIATVLLALENMTFIHASIAMLDVYYLTFMMGAFLLYLNRRYIASGVSVGLGALAKLNGALALPAIIIHWIFSSQKRSWWFLLTILFAILAFVELMILFDFAIVQRFSALHDPIYRIKEMMSLSGSLTFQTVTHEAASRPWAWLLSYKPMAYWYNPNYTGAISPSVWALTIPTFGYMVFRAIKRSEAGLFGAAWFTSTYLLWIPASILTDRVSYVFYFYPTIGSICLGMGMGLYDLLSLFRRRASGKLKWTALVIVILVLLAHLASFIILSPMVPIDYSKFLNLGG
jgi:predicted membrane-bound dolichyl-phosphate-mannose-protein mannosyltransferase